MSLFETIGTYDNLDEPTPFLNHKSVIYGFIITFLTITTICATLRLYVRFWVTRCPGWDDYFIVVILLISWVTNIGSLFLVKVGLGRHFILLGIEGMKDFIRMFWWCNANYNMAMTAIKLSLLFQYLRLLSDHPEPEQRQLRLVKRAIQGMIAVTATWGLIYSILAWVPCVPISADWDFTNTSAHRYGYGSTDAATFVATFLVHGACNMVIDIAIFTLPLFSRSLWATAGRQKQSRIAMLCLYALGIISVICSIVRFVSLVTHQATTYPTFDPTWYGPTAIVLSILEVDIATIMASLPVFWPYLRRNIDRIMITHEIEVKVTENFTQLEDDGTASTRPPRIGSRLGFAEGLRPADHPTSHHGNGNSNSSHSNNAATPWDTDSTHRGHCRGNSSGDHGGGGGGTKVGADVVMMRDLGRSGTDESQELGLPFDGTQSPVLRSPSRSHFMTRESKEILLR